MKQETGDRVELEREVHWYRCKWCRGEYKDGESNHYNLQTHRDGKKNRKPCLKRDVAIRNGAICPPTWMEANKATSSKTTQCTLSSYVKFSVETLNKIMVLWILLHALPWNRIDDDELGAALLWANPQAILRSPTWVSKSAKHLARYLQDEVISTLKNNSGWFCLIHDGWTTKGSRYAFLGVSASYINNDWEFKTVHLTLKRIIWNHYGVLLARPVGSFLIRHQLHHKISLMMNLYDSAVTNLSFFFLSTC